MPRESRILLTLLSVYVASLAGCSNGSSSNAPPTIIDPAELLVVAIKPGDGVGAVAPDAEVCVSFNQPVDDLPAVALVVSDGLNTLSGTLESTPDAMTWRWRPDVGMSRGANVSFRLASGIRSRSGIRLATALEVTFTVREVIAEATYEVSTGPGTVLMWPNGRRAATVGMRCHEVVFGSLVERPFRFQEDDLAYGDGSFLTRVNFASGVAMARRNLDGSEQLIALPNYNMRVAAVNTAGDAVLVQREQAFPFMWELHRLLLGAQVIEPLGATAASATSTFRPAIAEDGAILVGYLDTVTGRPAIQRIAANSTVPEIYLAEEVGVVGDVLCGVGADGVATLVWLSGTDVLRAATLAPGGALVQLQDDLELNGPVGSVSLELNVARSGSAVIEISTQVGSPGFVNLDDFIRLERTGWVGFPQRYGNSMPASSQPRVKFDGATGEWWVVRLGPSLGTLERLRSRPGETLGAPSLIYQSPLTGQFISSFDYGFDQYGRAIVALTEAWPSAKSYLVVLE